MTSQLAQWLFLVLQQLQAFRLKHEHRLCSFGLANLHNCGSQFLVQKTQKFLLKKIDTHPTSSVSLENPNMTGFCNLFLSLKILFILSVLLCVVVLDNYNSCLVFHSVNIIKLIYAFFYQWTFEFSLYCFTIMNNAVMTLIVLGLLLLLQDIVYGTCLKWSY